MSNFTIHFHGVHFSNGKQIIIKEVDEVVEPISVQEYNALVEGDCDTFYTAYLAIRKRVEERFDLEVEYVNDWDAVAEQE